MRPLPACFSLGTAWLLTALSGPGAISDAAACGAPIRYSLGEIDRRFDISRAELRRAVRDAAQVWEAAAGRELIGRRSGADFRIHLVYGEQQAATERVQDLSEKAGSLRARIEAKRERFRSAQARYDRERGRYEERVRTFKRDKADLKARAEAIQADGGGSQAEVKAIRERQKLLQQRAKRLQAEQRRLQDQQERLQRLAGELETLVERHNRRIEERNRVANPDREFRQGYYKRDGGGREQITIKQFRSEDRLRFVLAHELGHALGMGHVEDPEAVMYYLNERQDFSRLSLTAADRRALRTTCGSGR